MLPTDRKSLPTPGLIICILTPNARKNLPTAGDHMHTYRPREKNWPVNGTIATPASAFINLPSLVQSRRCHSRVISNIRQQGL